MKQRRCFTILKRTTFKITNMSRGPWGWEDCFSFCFLSLSSIVVKTNWNLLRDLKNQVISNLKTLHISSFSCKTRKSGNTGPEFSCSINHLGGNCQVMSCGQIQLTNQRNPHQRNLCQDP